MSTAFRTMVVPVDAAQLARDIAAALSEAGVGMFTVELIPADHAPTEGPATDVVSTGLIDAQFAPLLQDGTALYAAAAAVGVETTIDACIDLVARSYVSDQPPYEVFGLLGLQLLQPLDAIP